jgi:DNA-binding transcriptional regulator YhcF (GntR family)
VSRATTVDDVFGALLERIGSGALPLGAKLPSCRALADEFDSNPTTVNRALGRLAETGLVRIESRRGTFVAATEPSESVSLSQIRHQLEQVVERARPAGISREQLARLFDEVLADPVAPPRIAFVECNEADLNEMADVVERATGVTFERVQLHDLTKKSAMRFDAIAAPIFHLSDVYAIVGDLDRVIELNFVPTGGLLRQLASIDPDLTLGVATSLPRGIDRLSSLAKQYFSGEVRGVLTGHGPVDLDGIDVLLVTSATELSDDEARSVPRIVKIDWELEHASGATFEQRLHALLTDAAA